MNHLVIAPVLLPLLAGVLLLLLRPFAIELRRLLSLLAVIGQVVLAILLLARVHNGEILTYALGGWVPPFGIVLVADRLAIWMLLITTLLACFALLYAVRGTDIRGRHFHVLFQLQLFGLNGAFLTGDLFNLFVFFEILLLASYGLLLHGGGRLRTRAGLHFVVINLAGSTLFLFAVGTLYGIMGTLNMADLARQIAVLPAEHLGPVKAAGLLLFGVFALKSAVLPLHLWLPAAYANTSAPVAALFAIMTKVGAYSILRMETLLFGGDAGLLAGMLNAWLLPLALLTLAVGMLGVLAAASLRQQTAYLLVASVGSLLTAFGLGSSAGIAAGLYYLPHTTFATAALFLLADSISRRRGELDDRFEAGVVMCDRSLLGGLFVVAAMLIAGLPPMSGFIGKWLMLQAALPHPWLAWIMGVILVTSLLAIIALARAGSVLFYRAETAAPASGKPPMASRTRELLPATGLLSLCAALVIWAGPVDEFARATADQLLQADEYVHAVLGTPLAPGRGLTP
ncbi:monovalent cation/H+ antiporter subunit D [Sulfuriflexus sp.]|uniref:monovalent cation/H+ antiporter subunit D n=1 Tax=Sulfuriflexus sp. TaxID=2015443 RepID=UPI0028CD7F23|nr:monovalent cation/H+ antiporter subunit D [Sulfuriflexus sp.]MDT8405153.1 monovalent cation/H+ antiporter subunit D [Sulfuriflexus sp.]